MRSIAEAFELRSGSPDAQVFLSCEHASERLPSRWSWPEQDLRLVGTHWAFDPGARELTLELASALSAGAALSRFSRLLVDPNRGEQQENLFREIAEGQPVALNQGLSEVERALRIERYHRAFHAAFARGVAAHPAPVLLSLHTFTPSYEGELRSMAIGVLFNDDEADARPLGAHLASEFAGVRFNEPWSGREGLMYSVESQARRYGRIALELEVRNDLAQQPSFRAGLVASLARYFSVRRPSNSDRLQGR